MNKSELKKEHLLNAGLDVMKSHGYNGTSVKDIVDAAGVPKGSFYNYFTSKETFAIEALESVACETYRAAHKQLVEQQGPALDKLRDYFLACITQLEESHFKAGCFLGNMCQEMAETNETIRDKVRHILQRKSDLIAQVLLQGKEANDIAQHIDETKTAQLLLNAWEGSLIRMKATQSRCPLDAFLVILDLLKKH